MWNSRHASQGSRASSRGSRFSSTVSKGSHASTRGSQPRELEFQFFIRQTETLYPAWWTREGIVSWYRDLPDDTLWNCYICGIVLTAVVWQVTVLQGLYIDILDVVYNISYAIHIFAIGYKIVADMENTDITFWTVLSFLVDLGSFAHYGQANRPNFKLTCYFLRLHRPYRYLWSLSDYNLKGSILGTTLKYCYIFMVLRIKWAYVWLHLDVISNFYYSRKMEEGQSRTSRTLTDQIATESPGRQFLSGIYIINKMFIPIGPPVYPDNDVERIICLLIMMTGCLMVTGAAVASLSLIISLYMRPEETFRARYRLIMKEMKDTNVPEALREKVETFYKMYWHKQRAVSETQLLPTFPPTLPATINADIYFESTQKARILRELSYQLLSEIAKSMETIHYIPGDAIIKRGSKKCSIIYITYGDVEMLTAEDDNTAILRLTRGTVLTPCAGAISLALSLSHLAVRAATFCTAHVLSASDLWRIVYKHSVSQDHAGPILAAFTDHVERVKRHYSMKVADEATHKSSILNFNRNLAALMEMKNEDGELLLASSDVFLEIAGCYIMRNRADMTVSDQSDEICLRPTFPCILQPTSSLLFAWHFFVAMLILCICISHPYFLVYKKTVPLEFRFFDYATTGVFVVDNIVHLSTGANVEEGVPINFAQTSSQQMRSHWFVLDVVATLPIFDFIGDGHFAGINKILRLPKFFKVLKSLEEICVYRSNFLRFVSYTLLLLIACYLIAAMQQGFMCYQSGYCLVTNLTHPPFWEKKPLDEESVTDRLAFGLYWAISMINFTIHRETWGKENWKNVIYTLVILEVCIVLRIFMEAVYSATIMVTTALREDYGARISTVKNFLIRNEVDPLLRRRFITYLELCWYTDKAYKMTHKKHSNIFYDLPPHVFQDIVGRNRSKYILCIPFMKLLKKEDLRAVSSRAQLFYTSPNEILLNTGELTNEMYIIKRGICEILDPITHQRISTLTTKNHFGALICLLRLPAYNTIRAITHVQVFCIRRKYLLNALETPQIKVALDFLKDTPEFLRLQDKRMTSFVKYEPPPPTPNMMHFRLPRKHEPDTEFLQPFNRLGFLSILRYIFPRFTIRPDGLYLIRYEWFRVVCALCSAMLYPHYTYLVIQWSFLYYVSVFLDLTAYYDIFQRMLIGYFNDDGILVYHPASTAAYYMKGPFIMDLLGCLSLENLEAERKNTIENRTRVTATKQFLMLNRLIQLYRLPSAMMVLKQYIERRDVLMVFKAIPIFMAMINILTTFMIFYSVEIFYSEDDEGETTWYIEPYNDRGGSWLLLFSEAFRYNLTESPWNLHLATYFWVVYETSTTGYGEFNPSNISLMQILFLGMACSTMFITYFSVRIISIRANVNKSLAGFQQHLRDINMYMMREKLDSELQKEVRRYYEYNWEKMGGIDYRGVLKLCDQITLRTDAILHIYGPTFSKCPLLKESDVSLLRIIGRAVRGMYFLRDMKIIEHDDMVTDMYFVDYGGVEIRISTGEMSSIIRLPRGSVFGNMEGTAGNRSPYNVVATSRVHLMMIKSLAFTNIMHDFPSMRVLMDKYRGTDKKAYILGSEVQAKLRRNVTSTIPLRTKKSLVKYIYFEEGLVQLYLIAVCMGCIYMDLYNAGFQNNKMWMLITLYSLDFCFFLKICMQHSLPLLVTNKNVKKLMLPIRRMYFKREFRYDMLSILPMELFCFASRRNRWFWFAWLRLNRTIRVTTVHKCLRRRNEQITVNLTVTTMMGLCIWFTLFVHTSTCLWYFIGTYEDYRMPNSSWMYSKSANTRSVTNSHCDNHYICSLYFIITTFTQNGVGDIMPQKQSEVIFVSLLMILSTMIFMVYVGEFSNIIQYQSYRSFSFYSKYLELQDFMNNNRVSKNLVYIVNKYTLHLWRETRGMQVPHFLKNAPLSLRLRVMASAYLHHITRHHIFEECEPAFLRQLVGCLQLFTYNEGMFVVKESEITDSMYVIHTGKVKETCEDLDISARVYPAGSYFGILQGLVRNTPYTHSYQTMCKSQVLTLHLKDWEYLLKHFPDSKAAIHKHMRQVGDKDMDQSNWPGGAPEPEKPPEFKPLSEMASDYPGLGGPYPTPRPFGRRSSDADAPVMPPSSLRRASAFAWPTDSRNAGDEPMGLVGRPRQSDSAEREEDQATAAEDRPKLTFFQKFAMTAKKLMGRESDSEILGATAEGKDELLLEEDEEATEALLAQFEAAKRHSKDKRKMRQSRKSIFHAADEEGTEKHMLTLDIDESITNQQQQTEADPFTMRPLRIRDSEDEPREVLNLGRSRKSKVKKDAEEEEDEDRPSPKRSEKDGSFSRRPILFDPTAVPTDEPIFPEPPSSTKPTTSAAAKPFTKPKLIFPGASTSRAQADQRSSDTVPTQETPRALPDQEATADQADREIAVSDAVKDTSVSKPLDGGTEADQDIPDARADRGSAVEGSKPALEQEGPDQEEPEQKGPGKTSQPDSAPDQLVETETTRDTLITETDQVPATTETPEALSTEPKTVLPDAKADYTGSSEEPDESMGGYFKPATVLDFPELMDTSSPTPSTPGPPSKGDDEVAPDKTDDNTTVTPLGDDKDAKKKTDDDTTVTPLGDDKDAKKQPDDATTITPLGSDKDAKKKTDDTTTLTPPGDDKDAKKKPDDATTVTPPGDDKDAKKKPDDATTVTPLGDDKDAKKKPDDTTTITPPGDKDTQKKPDDTEITPILTQSSSSTLLSMESETEMTGPSLVTTPFTTSGTSKESRSSKTPATSGETDRSQYDADVGTPASEKASDVKSDSATKLAGIHKRKLSAATSSQADTREEGTATSASNLNRRFVHVRYDEKNDEQSAPPARADENEEKRALAKQDAHLSIFTMDSDEPSVADKSVGSKSEEDEDESSSDGPAAKKKKPFKRSGADD